MQKGDRAEHVLHCLKQCNKHARSNATSIDRTGSAQVNGLQALNEQDSSSPWQVVMGLPWIRLDTNFFDHPKVLYLVDEKKFRAIFVHLSAMTYSGKHGLDGLVPRPALRRIGGSDADAIDLVDAGLWTVNPGGWEIHGWTEYQLSSTEHEERRKRLSERGRRGAEKRWSQ